MTRTEGRVRAGWAAVVAAAILAGAAGLGIAQGGDQVQPAVILRLRGDVSIRPPGAAAWRRANERERIEPGTRIRTGTAPSEAILELSDRNLVRIGERTELALDVALVRREVDPEDSVFFFPARRDVHQFEVSLPEGNAANVLKGLRGNARYELRTPVATAGVRGTVFVADVRRERTGRMEGERGQGDVGGVTANFACVEGSITVTSPSFRAPVIVPEGFSLQVAGVAAQAAASQMPPAQAAQAADAAAPALEAIAATTSSSPSPLVSDVPSNSPQLPPDVIEKESSY